MPYLYDGLKHFVYLVFLDAPVLIGFLVYVLFYIGAIWFLCMLIMTIWYLLVEIWMSGQVIGRELVIDGTEISVASTLLCGIVFNRALRKRELYMQIPYKRIKRFDVLPIAIEIEMTNNDVYVIDRQRFDGQEAAITEALRSKLPLFVRI